MQKLAAAGALLILGACTDGMDPNDVEVPGLTANGLECSFDAPIGASGSRTLALVVGVGAYLNPDVPDLEGPPSDARRVYDFITSENGYRVPERNVCLLLDEQATASGFREAFERGLIERAESGDAVLIFFAGHGSQTRDANGDEPDEWDETLMLHDARVGAERDLVDDELNALLARLHARTENILLILDSCNSGTATRGDSGLVARFFEPDEAAEQLAPGESGDGDAAWGGEALPGLIAFTAASDGTPALERNGEGIFTTALLTVLGDAAGRPLTHAQVARRVPPLVAAKSYQIPYFQGDLQRPLLGSADMRRPIGWDVVVAGATVRLSGPPLPGIGVGAEMRIYDGAVTGAPDPAAAKASVVVTALSGVNAEARVTAPAAGAEPIEPGDLALLVRPGDEFLKIRVGLRAADEPGGLAANLARDVRAAIAQHPETSTLVDVVDGGGEFEVSAAFDGRLELRGPENRIRNTLADASSVAEALWQHARQRALLQLRGEGGTDFVDNETLQVRLVPATRQPACANGEWVQALPNEEQVVPLCHEWNVEVTLAEGARQSLLIGVLILSTDGSTFGLPRDGRSVLLRPGETTVFNASGETFRGTPPLDTRDQILVFGTQERNPVAWHLLTQAAASRGAAPLAGTLHQALDRYLRPGARGAAPVEESRPTTWTMTAIGVRVEANQRFLQPGEARSVTPREYTLKQFDIRPYLPDDPNSRLGAVLRTADALANASAQDGYGYAQHAWAEATDEANLLVGIDCSRAIWFAFTRSGLPYNRDNRYLPTSMMVDPDSLMSDEFEQCPVDEGFRLGDVLVYRSESDDPERRDTGHVVMVIDAAKRIAWGSHGWDGEGRAPGVEPDTGVEYQLIKYKADWERWDRTDMSLQMCWRHRSFAQEAADGRGVPGVAALQSACDPNLCRL